jgi:hypothetical protein
MTAVLRKHIVWQLVFVTFCSGRGMSGTGKLRHDSVYAATSVAATHSAATDVIIYKLTEITINTPLQARILDRVIGGGIILCGDVV